MILIKKYFPSLSEKQIDQFSMMEGLYQEWNQKINVISRKDMDFFYEKHVLHSLSVAKIISFKPHTKILDVGTGGGFPGIPLAILFPDASFHLVDSIGKKILVVQEVISALELKNVSAEKQRVELLSDSYDFILSRAVSDFSQLYHWTKNKVSKNSFNDLKNGIILLKGGDLKEELHYFEKRIRMFDLKDIFEEEFFETKKIVYMPV